MTDCTPEKMCDGCKAALHCMPTPIAQGAIDPPGTHISVSFLAPPMDLPIPDFVNHPPHYKGKKFESIDIIEDFDLGFHLGNAIKYILRAGKKGDRVEDIRKAIWYLERECNRG